MRASTCDYCGLPLSSTPVATAEHSESDVPHYCCYGCRFAAGVASASGDSAQARWLLTRLGLSVFCAMNVMVFTFVLWSQEEAEPEAASRVYYDVARYLCLLFSTPVLLMLAGPLIEEAWNEVRAARPSLNLLLAAGVVAAYVYSVASTVRGAGHVYFEVSSTVLVFVTLGRWFEASGKLRTTAALRELEHLLPDDVRLVVGESTELVPRQTVMPGQCVRVLAGERIPVDGVVQRNRASVDQQAITGESLPVVKEPGAEVYAGSLNVDGDLWIEATTPADSGLIARMIESMTRALNQREPYQRLAERVARRFVPLVTLIAVVTFAGQAWQRGWEEAVLASLSVVVIACPCALGLATPMALWAALGRAAQARVLIQEGDAFSRLSAANAVFFDKTGTLTTGRARLRDLRVDPQSDPQEVRAIASALAGCSSHPLARALVEAAASNDVTTTIASATAEHPATAENHPQLAVTFDNVATLAGRGVTGWIRGESQQVWLGSRRLLDEHDQFHGPLAASDEARETPDRARCWLAWGGRVRAVATFDEQIRPEAAETLEWFRGAGWRTAVLTGDGAARGIQLSALWHVPVHAELLPDEKLAQVEAARREGARVVMVGDGLNDAPALAAADVGVAMASGVDVSRHTAAVCLLGDDLRQLPWIVGLARQTDATIRWNLFWAFIYNVLGIAIAAAGWLNPIVAAVAMVVSSVLVVTNSLRLGHWPLLDAKSTVEPRRELDTETALARSSLNSAASTSASDAAPGSSSQWDAPEAAEATR